MIELIQSYQSQYPRLYLIISLISNDKEIKKLQGAVDDVLPKLHSSSSVHYDYARINIYTTEKKTKLLEAIELEKSAVPNPVSDLSDNTIKMKDNNEYSLREIIDLEHLVRNLQRENDNLREDNDLLTEKLQNLEKRNRGLGAIELEKQELINKNKELADEVEKNTGRINQTLEAMKIYGKNIFENNPNLLPNLLSSVMSVVTGGNNVANAPQEALQGVADAEEIEEESPKEELMNNVMQKVAGLSEEDLKKFNENLQYA